MAAQAAAGQLRMKSLAAAGSFIIAARSKLATEAGVA